MKNCGNEIPSTSNPSSSSKPYVRIVEQPAPRSLRFRYKSEAERSAGSIKGINSTTKTKTFPTIQVVGYQGRAKVYVSCVTNEEPYRPHPHKLVGEGCKYGVCRLDIPADTMTLQFTNLGIQCTKRQDIEAELEIRKRIDGFSHKNRPKSIDLSCVRLCFQVFLEDINTGQFKIGLHPVVSDTVHKKKTSSDLVIVELSDCVSYVDDDRKKIILLCQRVLKEDIQVRFFEEKNGEVVWEDFGQFHPTDVHLQTAISFRPPQYHNLDVQDPVKVFIQLRRPSDGATSEPLPFEYLPSKIPRRKRPKLDPILYSNPESNLLPINPHPACTQGVSGIIPGFADQFSMSNILDLPSTSGVSVTDNIWNIPPNNNNHTDNNIDSATWSYFLDILDSQNADFDQMKIRKGELSTEELVDVANLSKTINSNFALMDIGNDQNITDNSTGVANYCTTESLWQ